MAVNDVWRNLSREIGIYWNSRWEHVPNGAGVYGWFYPLRISTYDLDEFLDDVAKVLSFDATSNGPAQKTLSTRLSWERIDVGLGLTPDFPAMPQAAIETWAKVVKDPAAFERLRHVLMRGSLLMPPLYVGKAKNLNIRCQQHLAGTANNDFHYRYEEFARLVSLRAATVNDLLFACISTSIDTPDKDGSEDEDAIEGLVEEILKRACQPKYSLK